MMFYSVLRMGRGWCVAAILGSNHDAEFSDLVLLPYNPQEFKPAQGFIERWEGSN